METSTAARPFSAAAWVVGALLGVAALNFFAYPLDRWLYVFAIVALFGGWLIALGVAGGAVWLLGRDHGYRSAVVLALAAVLGFTLVATADLQYGYPQAYYWLHRSDFAAAAAADDDGRTVIVWFTHGSESGNGYAHAPLASAGTVVLTSPVQLVARHRLGDGWWWVTSY